MGIRERRADEQRQTGPARTEDRYGSKPGPAPVRRANADPDEALARHDSATALKSAPGALLETGVTSTNVGDLALYLRRPAGAAGLG